MSKLTKALADAVETALPGKPTADELPVPPPDPKGEKT